MLRIFLIIALLGAAALPGAVVAQETQTETNSTTTAPTDAAEAAARTAVEDAADQEASNGAENQTEYVTAVDPVTRVVSWDYSDGTFEIVFETDVPQLITLSESPDVEEGAGTFNIKQVRAPPGRTRVEIGAGKDAGAAVVTITTSQCIRSGSCPYISTGERSSGSPFKRTSSSAGWLGGTLVTAAMVATAAYRRKNKEQKGPETLE